MSEEYDRLLTEARDSLDMDQRLQAARHLAAAGRLLENEGNPARAMAVYQLAHELGMNAHPAMERLTSAGASLDMAYMNEARRWLGGLDFPAPDLATIHQFKPMVTLMWQMAEEMLDWMTTFSEEQVKATPWPAEGYARFKELIDPQERNEDGSPTGWQLWRTHAPVAGVWAFLELTRSSNPQCEALYRTFMTIGGQGARLYRRLSMARFYLNGQEGEIMARVVGPAPASQQSCFAGLFVWDLVNPEKSEPDWPTRARSYVSEPAVIVLTGMFSTLLEKMEGMLLVKLP